MVGAVSKWWHTCGGQHCLPVEGASLPGAGEVCRDRAACRSWDRACSRLTPNSSWHSSAALMEGWPCSSNAARVLQAQKTLVCCHTDANWAEGKHAERHLLVSLTELALPQPQNLQQQGEQLGSCW